METILVTGATGFTGSNVVRLLLKLGNPVRCLVRDSSDKTILANQEAVEWSHGDLADTHSLIQAMQGVDILVNVAYIAGYAANIVQAAEIAGVRRAVFVSSTTIFTTPETSLKAALLTAEDQIQQSHLSATILRPTMIYGGVRDRNMCRLIKCLQTWPVLPVFGNGNNLQQPVYVENLAWAIVHAVFNERTPGKAYTISGANALTYNHVIDTICGFLERKVFKIHLPVSLCVFAVGILEQWGLRMPITADQIARLNEDKAFDFAEAHRDFGYSPFSFAEGIAREIREMTHV